MAMDTGRRSGGALSEINVTPLVDVMLVLLVIFMVTAPLVTQGVEVRLPKASAAPLPEKAQDPVEITITHDRRIFIGKNEFRQGELGAKVQAIFRNRNEPDPQVYLRAEDDVPYGFVVRTMAELKRGGVGKIGMVTEPPDDRR